MMWLCTRIIVASGRMLHLQNRVRDINGLAEYPHRLPLHQRHQYVRCHFGKCSQPGDLRIPRTGALRPATSRPWQARGDSVVAGGPANPGSFVAISPQSGSVRMSLSFEELDFRPTPMGVLSLRRRRRPMSDVDVYEIKLGDEFLMSSQFTVAEIELARLGLAALDRKNLDVVVGGLGLGYTAQAVLENASVRSLIVVDALGEVIEWHRQKLLPIGEQLTGDPRCRLVHADFFAMSHSAEGFDPLAPGRRFDAVLVDIDHSPQNLLHPRHATLYRPEGLQRLAAHLKPGGVF